MKTEDEGMISVISGISDISDMIRLSPTCDSALWEQTVSSFIIRIFVLVNRNNATLYRLYIIYMIYVNR